MSRPTNADRILDCLAKHPDLDDDVLWQKTGIRPRQQVNQICRRLEAQGLLRRFHGDGGKIVNRLNGASAMPETAPPRPAPAPPPPRARAEALPPIRRDLQRTLVLIPCSGAKAAGGKPGAGGGGILDVLAPDLAARLKEARQAVAPRAALDERALLPAWQRNDGFLYRAARRVLGPTAPKGVHLLIISGGYGVVRADEPIGDYNARLNLSWWPRGLLEQALIAYARGRRLDSVIAFASATTDYGRLIARVPWAQAGVSSVLLLTPEKGRGALVKSPRAQGEALAALLTGGLTGDWRSSDGLQLTAQRLV